MTAPFELSPLAAHYLNEALTGFIAAKVIQPGDTVFDLGANVGLHTSSFSKLVGEQGKVHAFEPNPALFGYLTTIPNVRVWPVAVGDQLSLETFYLPLDNSEVGSLVDAREMMGDMPTKMLTVPQVPIDQLHELNDIMPSFIKIDVERYEYQAINGMLDLIERSNPVIVFESNTDRIEALLESIGYEVASMTPADLGLNSANVVAFNRRVHSPDKFLPIEADIQPLIEQAISAADARISGPQSAEMHSPALGRSFLDKTFSAFTDRVIRIGPKPVAERMIEGEKARLIRAGFDSGFYLKRNSDVAVSGMDAVEHFVRHGRYERRAHRFVARGSR